MRQRAEEGNPPTKKPPEGGLLGRFGGARRDRTADLLHAMQALSQLSYGPITAAALGRRNVVCFKQRRSL